MFTAYDAETDKYIPVKPIAVDASSVLCKRVPHETLFIADAKTGQGIWFDDTGKECFIDLQSEDFRADAEKISLLDMGSDKWKTTADMKLAKYGLKLGGFDEKAGGWELIEL